MAGRVGHACPPPPEEAAQDAALQRLQQRALPGAGVAEQLQLDPGLRGLGGSQLLDVAQLVVVLGKKRRRRRTTIIHEKLSTAQVTLRNTFICCAQFKELLSDLVPLAASLFSFYETSGFM